jgi:hypothetical protein
MKKLVPSAAVVAVITGLLVAVPTGAQLIDPNQRCVYRPGSTTCEPIGQPRQAPQAPSSPPYSQFVQIIGNSGIDLRQHATYSDGYFENRARLYCSLLARGEMVKINQEVAFPPVVNFTETPRDRPRMEMAILRVAALNYCPAYWAQEQQIEGVLMR